MAGADRTHSFVDEDEDPAASPLSSDLPVVHQFNQKSNERLPKTATNDRGNCEYS
jgi:hypothetical protein